MWNYELTHLVSGQKFLNVEKLLEKVCLFWIKRKVVQEIPCREPNSRLVHVARSSETKRYIN